MSVTLTEEAQARALGDIFETLSDSGNARRFAKLYRHRLRWSPERGCWMVRRGVHWHEDRTLCVWRFAKAAVTRMINESIVYPYPYTRRARIDWAAASESTDRLAAMIENAKSEMILGAAESRSG
jgi:hypothetical protein